MRWLKWLLDLLLSKPTQPPVPTTTTPPPPTTTPAPLSTTLQLLNAHNKYRSRFGLPNLIINEDLLEAAQGHADWMASTGIFSHTGSGGSSMSDRITSTGYHYIRAGENIASGYSDVESVMNGWISSPGHESNIRGNYVHVGFGVAIRNGKILWVADFGSPSMSIIQPQDAVMCLPEPLLI